MSEAAALRGEHAPGALPEARGALLAWVREGGADGRAFLQVHGYVEASEILAKPAPEGLGLKITKGMLERYYHERADQETLAQLPELRESADAWNAFKEHATPTYFDEAAIERLKVRAFQLSGTLKSQKEFTQLKGLFQILFAARHTEVRERTIANRERNTVIRENESWERIKWMRHRRTTAQTKPTPNAVGPVSAPDAPEPGQPAGLEELERVARVIRHCGGVEDFIGVQPHQADLARAEVFTLEAARLPGGSATRTASATKPTFLFDLDTRLVSLPAPGRYPIGGFVTRKGGGFHMRRDVLIVAAAVAALLLLTVLGFHHLEVETFEDPPRHLADHLAVVDDQAASHLRVPHSVSARP